MPWEPHINRRGDDSSMEVFRGSPANDDVKVTSQGKLVTTDPDFKSSANFEWEAKSCGFFQVDEQETRFNFTNINGRTQQRYELIESREFHLAALELGGLYVCQE
ncbi:PREDICTED: uncharacterized protein LOC107337985 isoform X2 [Acropora digitifera]|uniref:uncharacterized protein LOC107337985 isoform X2 n=1 Tax=Acropora digitifera TaxID=70779 RepID=UPI000779FEC1|nr:PREDICTED: uncharacterized protein LOC107337985 isoform X2 [Acropora digitifera]